MKDHNIKDLKWTFNFTAKHKRQPTSFFKPMVLTGTASEAKKKALQLVAKYLAKFAECWEEHDLMGWDRVGDCTAIGN